MVSLSFPELVEKQRDEGIQMESRVFFMDSSHRLTQSMLNSDVPSVNIRGMMDQVSMLLSFFYRDTDDVFVFSSPHFRSQIRLLWRQLWKCSEKSA